MPEFDEARASAAIKELLIAIGEDPERDGLLETPDRVARSFRELVSGMNSDGVEILSTVFDIAHDELVLVSVALVKNYL